MYNQTIFLTNPILRSLGARIFDLKQRIAHHRKPPYAPCHDKIILDITYVCNLNCIKCNRSCRHAPSDDMMTLSQVEAFLRESVDRRRKWRQIWIEGGEPTLHPDLDGILDLIMDYRKKHNPSLKIQVNSNGFGAETVRKLQQIGRRVKIYSSEKTSPDVDYFCAFNLAPCDFDVFSKTDFSMGCYYPSFYGLSLNMYGYYHCSNAGGIDRVLGLDIGMKSLPDEKDRWWQKQMSQLCKYCGYFVENNRCHLSIAPPDVDFFISDSWQKMFERYHAEKISLTQYS